MILRHDNADLRLTDKGRELGLIDDERYAAFEAKRQAIKNELDRLGKIRIKPNDEVNAFLRAHNSGELKDGVLAADFLKRPEVQYADLMKFIPAAPEPLERHVIEQVEIQIKYAGSEAALAAARMGNRTLLMTINLDMVAFMPCNPSVGGPAKGIVVREIDALGGEMGRNIDKTYVQMRMLNTGKGPAVRALRAQADKHAYHAEMKHTIEREPNLTLRQGIVDGLIVEDGVCKGVIFSVKLPGIAMKMNY
ncbi:hypothetical protein WP50_24675 [Lactiplantibacillus plantarum]|nr:hypothetical protein WP50_24675 [Lactiplantibacillus plantarum]